MAQMRAMLRYFMRRMHELAPAPRYDASAMIIIPAGEMPLMPAASDGL